MYFHRLARYPGPFWWKVSRLPFVWALLTGRLPHLVNGFHDTYGSVVRLAPDELSFNEAGAWKDIYQRQALDRPQEARSKPPGVSVDTFISASHQTHARLRKPFIPAFSGKAIAAYEPIVTRYTALFIQKLKEASTQQKAIDLNKWFNFLFFDIVMDLGWGSNFDCLNHQQYNMWITFVTSLKEAVIAGALNYIPLLRTMMPKLIPPSVKKQVDEVFQVCAQKVKGRLDSSSSYQDIFSFAQGQPEYSQLSREEVEQAAFIIITAGSETVTSTLVGTLNYLIRKPSNLQRLIKETRAAFVSLDDINGSSTSSLPFLNAVLKEGLRLAAPIPDGLRRVTPPEGLQVAGHHIPGGIVVSTGCLAQAMNPLNFSNPTLFQPERWLENGNGGESANVMAFCPFSLGSRGCLGQGLAWMELRVALCAILWQFDIEVESQSQLPTWHEQDIWWFWDKTPLNVCLRDVRS